MTEKVGGGQPRISLLAQAGLLVLVAGCAGTQSAPNLNAAQATGPIPQIISDAQAEKILAERLKDDPNGELCQAIVAKFNAGDDNALKDHLDRSAMAERAIFSANLGPERAAVWRKSAEGIENFSRLLSPKGSRFFCLGTFGDASGEKSLVLRLRQKNRFDHIVLRLGGSAERPVDDYLVASGGYWHSALQTAFEGERLAPHQETRDWMFKASFEQKFDAIIEKFDALPKDVQRSEFMFLHYVNAVTSSTTRGREKDSPRFVALEDQIKDSFSHPIARAYWLLVFYARMGDRDMAKKQISALAEPYQDPIAHDLHRYLDRF
jgi:hypothetical protein